jgi:hypothetical protein
MKQLNVLKATLLTLALTAIFAPSRTSASITIYTDLAAWQAAVGSSVVEPFNSSGLQPTTVVSSIAGGIGPARGVFSGSVWNDDMYNNPSFHSGTSFSYSQGQLKGAGALWDTSVNGDGIGIDVSLDGGSQSVGHIGGIHGSFFGWTSSTPFNSVFLSIYFLQNGGGETFDMDNLQFAPVPEPGVAPLLGGGLIVAGFARRLRTRD